MLTLDERIAELEKIGYAVKLGLGTTSPELYEYYKILAVSSMLDLLTELKRLREENEGLEYKTDCLVDRLTGGLYSKSKNMTIDQIMNEHEAWHERFSND